MTDFSQMIRELRVDGGDYTITLPDDWLQGRTAYGGLSAALCLAAAQLTLPDAPALRSAQFAFVGPATGALRIAPRVLRRGKSTVFAGVDLAGDAGLAVRSTLCFAASRPSQDTYNRHSPPTTAPLEHCPSFYSWPNRPNFMNHFEGRLAGGSAPLSSSASPEMLVWLRHRDSSAHDDLVSLMALADALPPAAFGSFEQVVPISTMTWAVDLLTAEVRNASGWWLVQSSAETIREGYSAQNTTVWSADGEAVISARQTVAIFDKK